MTTTEPHDVSSQGDGPAPDAVCPKCGHPRASGQIECSACGICFHKFKAAKNVGDSAAAPESVDEDADKPARTHVWMKILIAVVAVVVLLVVVGKIVQSGNRSRFDAAVAQFDERFSIESKAAFEQSLEDLKNVIEVAAITVNQRGWKLDDTEHFWKETDERYQRFIDAMNEVGKPGTRVFDYHPARVHDSLCGGMHILPRTVRHEPTQVLWDMSFPSRYRKANGGPCRVAEYETSKNRVLVILGTKHVLRDRTDDDRAVKAFISKVETEMQQRGESWLDQQIFNLQTIYHAEHGRWCGDIDELLDVAESVMGPTETTTELRALAAQKLIALQLDRGGMYIVRDRRPKPQ